MIRWPVAFTWGNAFRRDAYVEVPSQYERTESDNENSADHVGGTNWPKPQAVPARETYQRAGE